MKHMIPRGWRAFALALPSLAALALPLPALARESREPNQERQRESWGDLPAYGRAGIMPPVNGPDTFAPKRAAGMPLRRVTPDQDRMRELSGQVVKLNGMVLYVQTQLGAVVPLDLSALELRRTPEPGQTVVAVYQVENSTENVALSLQGEVKG
jgi:hypothetical protein